MWMNRCKAIGGVAVCIMMMTELALAEPRFARQYRQHYGYMPACDACHKDGGGTALNAYGDAFKKAGGGLAAFAGVAAQDADADGYSNQQEAEAKANPGRADSTPDTPGDWLNTANLIPREVQAVFPRASAYKPLDAILTATEIKRAEVLGVSLSKEDETTIYVAVEQGKAAGTAIIVPAHHEGRQFFVLLATDRQLEVIHAQALHPGELVAAEDPALYRPAFGQKVESLQLQGEGLQAAVSAALRRAGAILYVRLKKG